MFGRMLKRSLSSLILIIGLLALSMLAVLTSANSLTANSLTTNPSPDNSPIANSSTTKSSIDKPLINNSLADKPSPLLDQDITSIGRPNFRVFNDKQGLPQNTINCLLQDAQGNIWIGTQD